MKREIKFRGLSADGKWYYGFVYDYILVKKDKAIRYTKIIDWNSGKFEKVVRRNTVGQFTGLKDKNGTEIFEGDKLINEEGKLFIMGFKNGSFTSETSVSLYSPKYSVVIGNIHEP